MKRTFAIVVLALAMSCSKQDSAHSPYPQEEHAVALASAKCGCPPTMPWLRDMIRQSETDTKYKGMIYAIEYSNGVAVLHQPWLSSCFGCLVFDCNGDALKLTGSALDEIISGATEDNVIYSTSM